MRVIQGNEGGQPICTYSEVVKLKEFIDQSQMPIHSVIVASDAYHMRRARWTYRQVLGDKISMEMTPVLFKLSPCQRQWISGPLNF